jgi:putative ABC transport system substrate-binding protein
MKKKIISLVLGAMFLALSFPAHGQQSKKIPRIGLLSIGADPQKPVRWLPFLDEIKKLGYVEGHNIIIERRFAAGRSERLPELVADLVRLKVDLVVATGPLENLAAKKEMPTTAIVMMLVPDPVAAGLIGSLAHPGGNVTGLSNVNVELSGKRVELLKEAVPNLTRLTILTHPAFSTGVYELMLRETESAGQALGLQRRAIEVRDRDELPKAFSDMGRGRLEGFVVYGNPVFYSLRQAIVELAAKKRLPAIYDVPDFVESGGLMSYGASYDDLSRRSAIYVDKILKGAKPADLPVEQPKTFEFVINLKAAKQIGVTIPPNVLVRADKVIR